MLISCRFLIAALKGHLGKSGSARLPSGSSRWAEPVVKIRDRDGTIRHFGLLTGGKPKGRGRGRGWDWTLSEDDLLTATFIQYALDRMAKHTLGGHTIGDAGLWSFLWGAPVQLPVIRYYLIESLDAREQRVTKRLQSHKADREDEVFDLIERLARHVAYDHPILKAADVRV